jgi:hypothetical protein
LFDVAILDFQIQLSCTYFGIFGFEIVLGAFLKIGKLFLKCYGHPDSKKNYVNNGKINYAGPKK